MFDRDDITAWELYPSFELFGSLGLRSSDSKFTRDGNSGKFVPAASLEEMQNRTDWGDLLQPEQLQAPSNDFKDVKWRRPDW